MREFLNKPAGKITAVLIAVVALGIFVYSMTRGNSAAAQANTRMYVDSATGKAFSHGLILGEIILVQAPSGSKTGYPAALCYWPADGSAKADPDYVLLNEEIGKKGPTFCPVCHRLVVSRNPMPGAGVTPPPTEEEYKKSSSRFSSDSRN